jgi:hypothetical protein
VISRERWGRKAIICATEDMCMMGTCLFFSLKTSSSRLSYQSTIFIKFSNTIYCIDPDPKKEEVIIAFFLVRKKHLVISSLVWSYIFSYVKVI